MMCRLGIQEPTAALLSRDEPVRSEKVPSVSRLAWALSGIIGSGYHGDSLAFLMAHQYNFTIKPDEKGGAVGGETAGYAG